MSQSIITLAFEQYKAEQESTVTPVELNEFVLANVPNQDPTLPIDRAEGLPSAQHIVHVADVSQAGYINLNAVVYSLIMDTGIGDFDFNWIGLRNKESGILAAISHTPTVHKLKTITGIQNGNSVTRSIMMGYVGAKGLTNINVDASTWQIDFTARLMGIDERERLANLDHYGQATFLTDGFKVNKNDSVYTARAGIGYVGGLRCYAADAITINNVLPSGAIYLKASWQGQLTSQWQTVYSLAYSKAVLNDHIDSEGVQQYVVKIADVDGSGNVIDARFVGGRYSYERVDNAATDADIDVNSGANKHVKLPQLWRGIAKKIKDAFERRTISTEGALQGGGTLASDRTFSIKDATTEQKGAVQLENSVSSTSITTSAVPASVKKAMDKAGQALDAATNMIPVGIPLPWPLSVPPTGWLEKRGQSFNKVAFPLLAFAYPSGKLKDLRAEVIRGWDNDRGIDIGRQILSQQMDSVRALSISTSTGTGGGSYLSSGRGDVGSKHTLFSGVETRSRNVAFMYIVKAA